MVSWVGSPAAEVVTVTVTAIPALRDHILLRILDSGTTQLLHLECGRRFRGHRDKLLKIKERILEEL